MHSTLISPKKEDFKFSGSILEPLYIIKLILKKNIYHDSERYLGRHNLITQR